MILARKKISLAFLLLIIPQRLTAVLMNIKVSVSKRDYKIFAKILLSMVAA